MTIATPPTTPVRTDPATFSARMDAYLAWIGTDLVPGLNTYSGMTNSGSFTDGSAASPGITFALDLDTGFWRPGNNLLACSTGGSEAWRVASNGYMLLGVSTPMATLSSKLTVAGTDFGSSGISQASFQATAGGTPYYTLAKSRGATVGDYTIVQANDYLGILRFVGTDGTGFVSSAAMIVAQVAGTPAAGDVRANLLLQVGNGAGTTGIALKLTNGQQLGQDGTYALPAWSFNNDPDTGIYSAGANIMGFVTFGGEALRINASQQVLATGQGGLGYGPGAGAGVTQITSRTTGVTINNPCGSITMFSAAGSATAATFTVTNSKVGANDTITLSQKSGTNLYNFIVTAVAAGSFNITFYTTGGTAVDAPVINFTVNKGSIT